VLYIYQVKVSLAIAIKNEVTEMRFDFVSVLTTLLIAVIAIVLVFRVEPIRKLVVGA